MNIAALVTGPCFGKIDSQIRSTPGDAGFVIIDEWSK
jgi:hypothetical protein